jgi:hypothetical protein
MIDNAPHGATPLRSRTRSQLYSTGTGVTLVLLGDSSLSISGGTVNLYAPTTNGTYPDLSGVLIDDQAPNKSNNAVTVNGGGTVELDFTSARNEITCRPATPTAPSPMSLDQRQSRL